MRDAVVDVLVVFDWAVLAYFLVLNTTYLVLILTASHDIRQHFRRRSFAGHDDVFANPLTPPVSLIAPAHNEGPTIVESVRAMLSLAYPEFEVVVVDDGSTDDTFERLAAAFDLVEVPTVVPDLVPTTGEVLSVHVPRGDEPLVAVRKVSAGNKADASNSGINASRYPLLCMVDSDAILEESSLLVMAKPFIDDPVRMVATGGSIRPVNGCQVYRGRVTETGMPRSWLARIQVMEYLRAFLLGRSGWSRLQGMLIISGAFGMFRRDLVVEVGGYDSRCIGEDADLVARLHRLLRDRGQDYRIEFVSEPVCWTEVPESLAALGRQRRRWSRGLAEVLWSQRRMIGNPRYGRIGVVVLPHYLAFELLGPVVELLGVVSVGFGLAFGLVNLPFAMLFFMAAFGYGLLLSVVSLAIEEASYHRYDRGPDLAVVLAAAVAENVGFRQIHAWWRLRGLWETLRGRELEWGAMERTGFDAAARPPDSVSEKRRFRSHLGHGVD